MDLPELDFVPTMPNAIKRATRQFGDNDYVVMPGRRMTFAEADRASQRVAKEMLARGIGKGTRVGMHFSYGFEWIIAFSAASRIGALCVPMSTAYRPAELRKTVIHADIDTLIIPERLFGEDHLTFVAEAFASLADAGPGPLYLPEAPFLRSIWVAGDTRNAWAERIDLGVHAKSAAAAEISDAFLESVEAQVTPGDWLMLIHTSGTTGDPKGVIHTHGSFIRHNENLSDFNGITADTTQFSGLPWFWIGGVVLSVGHALAKGFKLLCLEKFENEAALDLIIEEKPWVVGMWGQLGQRFRQYVDSTGRDVSGVPAFAPPADGVVDAGLRHNSLGQTESMGPHTAPGPEAGKLLPEALRGSFGPRVTHVEHRIVDVETGDDVEPGEEGELIVRGYSISAGLYKCERHEAFDDDGWLHTGDHGYFKESFLFFTGRFTEMIKTLGSNVAPREVELTLEAAPNVGLAIVMGVSDDDRGEIVAAILIPVPGTSVDVDAVRVHVADELSSYKVPRHMMIVESDDMPALGSGKPDKRTLFQMLLEDIGG
jgi:acyl-CoA synthetase (AMP-forming)/AMP-acid ligase II